MSELRSKYPQAEAWTFFLPDTATAPARGKEAKRTVAGSRKGEGNTATAKAKQKRVTGDEGSMGACCSANTDVSVTTGVPSVALTTARGGASKSTTSMTNNNKENAGRQQAVLSHPEAVAVLSATTAASPLLPGKSTNKQAHAAASAISEGESAPLTPSGGGGSDSSVSTAKTREQIRIDKNGKTVDHLHLKPNGQQHVDDGAGLLDATSLISPEPSLPSSISRAEGSAFEEILEEGEGDAAWLARGMSVLRGGSAVDVSKLAQVCDHYKSSRS